MSTLTYRSFYVFIFFYVFFMRRVSVIRSVVIIPWFWTVWVTAYVCPKERYRPQRDSNPVPPGSAGFEPYTPGLRVNHATNELSLRHNISKFLLLESYLSRISYLWGLHGNKVHFGVPYCCISHILHAMIWPVDCGPPANTRRLYNAGSLLGQRCRR